MRSLRVVVLLSVGVGLFGTLETSAQDFGDITAEELAMGAPESYPEADALILFDHGQYTITRGRLEIVRHIRIKVLTNAGRDQVGEASFYYYNEYEKISLLKAHTVTPDGSKHKVGKKEIHTKSVGRRKQKVISFPQVVPGCIIEYTYTRSTDRFRYLKPWFFQNRHYTLSSVFTVTISPGYTFNVSYQNVPADQREAEKSDSRSNSVINKSYKWNMNNLDPIKWEPYMKALNDYRSSLRFQLHTYQDQWNYIKYIEGWGKTGETFQQYYLNEYLNEGRAVKKLAKKITSGLSTDEEKSRALYDYVVSEFKTSFDYEYRYFTQENMESMFALKKGSPEEKNVLLVELHKAAGIDSWPVLISRIQHGVLKDNNPDLQQFDYLLTMAKIGESYYFLDCTSNLIPYGMTPADCRVNQGLMIDGDNSQLIKVPMHDTPSYRLDMTRMFIDTSGMVSCSSTCTFTQFYLTDQVERMEEEGEEDYVKSEFVDRILYDYELDDYHCARDAKGRFVTTLNFSSEDLARRLQNNILVNPVRYAFRHNPFESEKRFFPVDFNYPLVYVNQVEFFFDSNVEKYILPKNVSFEMEGASFVQQSTKSDTSVTVIAQLKISNPVFLEFQYYQLRQFFDQVAASTEVEVRATLAE